MKDLQPFAKVKLAPSHLRTTLHANIVLTINCLHRRQLLPIYPTRNNTQGNIANLATRYVDIMRE